MNAQVVLPLFGLPIAFSAWQAISEPPLRVRAVVWIAGVLLPVIGATVIAARNGLLFAEWPGTPRRRMTVVLLLATGGALGAFGRLPAFPRVDAVFSLAAPLVVAGIILALYWHFRPGEPRRSPPGRL
jgi:hypothetical protein